MQTAVTEVENKKIVQTAVTEPAHTTVGWRTILEKFSAKVDGLEAKMKSLVHEREGLLLDAELGLNGAAKKLQKVDEEIAGIRRDCQTTREAIVQAQQRHDAAKQAEAAEAEKQRTEQLRALAVAAREQAKQFTAALNQTVSAGSSLRMIVRNMSQRATKEERPMIQNLLESGVFMRAAEGANLRSLLEFQSYPGPREHLTPLDEALSVFLGRWLAEEKDGE
jgi:hypothetical protein